MQSIGHRMLALLGLRASPLFDAGVARSPWPHPSNRPCAIAFFVRYEPPFFFPAWVAQKSSLFCNVSLGGYPQIHFNVIH